MSCRFRAKVTVCTHVVFRRILRWPPDPTSPGRFNVEEALDDLAAANVALGKLMGAKKLGAKKALYSPALMHGQIEAIRAELMALKYFGE